MLILSLLFILITKREKKTVVILPYNNIFCKDKTVKEFARNKLCQRLIEDYCLCYYKAECNLAKDVKNYLVNFASINDRYYLHILQKKDQSLTNVIFELDSNFYIKSVKCIKN